MKRGKTVENSVKADSGPPTKKKRLSLIACDEKAFNG